MKCRHLYDSQSQIYGSAEIQILPLAFDSNARDFLNMYAYFCIQKQRKEIDHEYSLIDSYHSQNEMEWPKITNDFTLHRFLNKLANKI